MSSSSDNEKSKKRKTGPAEDGEIISDTLVSAMPPPSVRVIDVKPYPYGLVIPYKTLDDLFNASTLRNVIKYHEVIIVKLMVIQKMRLMASRLVCPDTYLPPPGWTTPSEIGEKVEIIQYNNITQTLSHFYFYEELVSKGYCQVVKFGETRVWFPNFAVNEEKEMVYFKHTTMTMRKLNKGNTRILELLLMYITREGNTLITEKTIVPLIEAGFNLSLNSTSEIVDKLITIFTIENTNELLLELDEISKGHENGEEMFRMFCRALFMCYQTRLTEGAKYDLLRELVPRSTTVELRNFITSLEVSLPVSSKNFKGFTKANGVSFKVGKLSKAGSGESVVMSDRTLPGANIIPVLKDDPEVVLCDTDDLCLSVFLKKTKKGVDSYELHDTFGLLGLHYLEAKHIQNVFHVKVDDTEKETGKSSATPTASSSSSYQITEID